MSKPNNAAATSVQSVVLLPCPFCGNDADDTQGFHGLTVIGCSHCQTAQTEPFDEYANAVAVWNRRDGDPCREGCKITCRTVVVTDDFPEKESDLVDD